MGTWGAGLFFDDTTCDVRDEYVQSLKSRLSHLDSCRKILDRYASLLEDAEVACLVYLALADTAWRYGRLDQALQDRAVSLLRSGGDVFVWERDAPKDAAFRRKALQVLQVLQARLLTPQSRSRWCLQAPKDPHHGTRLNGLFSGLAPGQLGVAGAGGLRRAGKSVDPVFSVLARRVASHADMPAHITESDATLVLSKTSYRPYQHIAILPKDERRNILAGLVQTDITMEGDLPYQKDSTVWLALGRLTKEIDAHLSAQPTSG